MPHGITQCYLPPGRCDIPALTPAEAGTRLRMYQAGRCGNSHAIRGVTRCWVAGLVSALGGGRAVGVELSFSLHVAAYCGALVRPAGYCVISRTLRQSLTTTRTDIQTTLRVACVTKGRVCALIHFDSRSPLCSDVVDVLQTDRRIGLSAAIGVQNIGNH